MDQTYAVLTGRTYTVTTSAGCTITKPDNTPILSVPAGKQGYFTAPCTQIVVSSDDENTDITLTFNGASTSAVGGGDPIDVDLTYTPTSANAQSGIAVEQGLSDIDTHVEDYGVLEAALDLSAYCISTTQRTAATNELWFEMGGTVYQITWPDAWIWLDGSAPSLSANTAYCVTVRTERAGRIIANLAYCYTPAT